MTIEQYASAQAQIVARLVQAILRLLSPFRSQSLTTAQYTVLTDRMYAQVDNARRESARLGRQYFDRQWAEHRDGDPPAVDLAGYARPSFEYALEPVRNALRASSTPRDVLAQAAIIAQREAENGGRRTILRAVEDSDNGIRWARYDPIPPTCAFCLMAISRGPVFRSRESATQTSGRRNPRAIAGEAWHPGCTCKAVPVFDESHWDGRDQYVEADALWREATRGWSGTNALNAFRRAAERQGRESGAAAV